MKKLRATLCLSAICAAAVLSASGCGGSATQLGGAGSGSGGARATGGTSATKGGGPAAAGRASTGAAGQPDAGTGEAGAGAGTGSTAPLPPCASDKACAAAGQLCNPTLEVCVDCRTDSDCGKTEQCIASTCKAFVSCINSLGCAANQVCDEAAGRCVDCVGSADCPITALCVAAQCRAACGSDKDCVSNNQLCNRAGAYCVDCLKDADCGAASHCSAGACAPNLCTPLSTSCLGTELFTCNAHGAGYTSNECAGGCSDSPAAHCAGTGEAGATGTGGSGCVAPPSLDVVAVPDCGTPGAESTNSYSGVVTITVSGVTYGAPNVPNDAFYALAGGNLAQSTATCPGCVAYNRASEGSCVCPVECAAMSHRLSDIVIGGYPAFNPLHTYTVQIDLGTAPAQRLNFGFGDCGCSDNSAGYSVQFDCAP